MKITTDELLDIIAEASLKLHQSIRNAYNQGNLTNFLMSIGMEDLIPEKEDQLYDTDPEGKIIIFGDSQVKENDIFGCLKELGLPKDRVELRLGYKEAVKYPFEKLQYNYNYRLILFGPVPHSTKGKDDSSSIITSLESKDGYTKILRLTDGHKLKLTKSNLKSLVEEEIQSGYLIV